ncbi:MAG: hypothetical protein K2J85_06105, partial [Anaeroplasmataceae bacterium]|nr:hypothetical protein [Anaeroplasmataceae bacterium]
LCLGILLGLVSLTACDENASITYVDGNGQEQTMQVTATDDKEVIQTVIEFAGKAAYDDITSFTLKESVSVSASLTKDMNAALELGAKDKLSGSANMVLNVSKDKGLDLSASGNLSLGKDNQAKVSADVIYEGALDQMLTENQYVYVDASYDVKSIANTSKGSVKKAIDTLALMEEAKEELDDIISNFLPGEEPDFGDDMGFGSIEDFYTNFKNSKLTISNVKNGVIYLEADLALKDLINYVDPDNAELKPLLKLETSFVFTYGIEASTGRFREFNFEFDDVSLLNLMITALLGSVDIYASTSAMATYVETFHFESKFAIEYNNAKIRTLSDADKAKYSKDTI